MKNLNKKALAALGLAGLMTFSPSLTLAVQFKDVPSNHWAYSSINRLSDAKVIYGYPDGSFQPNRKVSYLEIMSLLRGLVDPTEEQLNTAVKKYVNLMDELKIPVWSRTNVALALDRGIVSETTLRNAALDGMLVDEPAPGKYPTRAMVAEFYAIALGIDKNGNKNYINYKDQADLMNTANNKMQYNNIEGLVAAQVEAGILSAQGRGDGRFHAKEEIMRSEIARITDLSYNYMKTHVNKKAEGKVFITNNSEANPTFLLERQNDSNLIFYVDKDTRFMRNGKVAKFSDLRNGAKVKIEYRSNQGGKDIPVVVDILESNIVATGYVTHNVPNSDTIRISYAEGDKIPSRQDIKSIEDFTFDKDAKITRYNDPIKKKDISYDDVVQFTAEGNVITELNLIPKSATVTGNNVVLTYDNRNYNKGTLKITLPNKKEYTFNLNSQEMVFKAINATTNSTSKTNFTLNLNYMDVANIERTAINSTEHGVLKSLTTTGNTLSLDLEVDGKIYRFPVDSASKWNRDRNEVQLIFSELSKYYDYFVIIQLQDGIVKTLTPIGKDVRSFSGEVAHQFIYNGDLIFNSLYRQRVQIFNTGTPIDGLYDITADKVVNATPGSTQKVKGYYGTVVENGKVENRILNLEIEGINLHDFKKVY